MKNKLLVILGSTSTGKTDLGLELAKKFNGELVSADSRQVYKYLDIGTGKMPSGGTSIKGQVLRGKEFWIIDGVRIWMYDVVDPGTRSNLYKYILKTEEVIRKIIQEGKLPVLVGGTGLYIRSLLEGVSDFGINENKNLRNALEGLDIEDIRRRINKTDPEVLRRMNNSELNNKRRLIRLLEKLTGSSDGSKSFSGLKQDFDILKIGLKAERIVLRKKIRNRVISRIAQGMVEESKDLLERGILTYPRMAELGLEYKYIARYLKAEIKSREELVEILGLKIGQFARRQETWFKKEKDVLWFDIEDNDFIKKVEKQVQDWYNET